MRALVTTLDRASEVERTQVDEPEPANNQAVVGWASVRSAWGNSDW